MKAYWGSGGIAPRILDLDTRWRDRDITPGTYWIGGWVEARAGLDAVVKGKLPDPTGT
jgi:hypothetical protein